MPTKLTELKGPGKIDEEKFIELFQRNPNIQLREAAKILGVSHNAVWKAKNRIEGIDDVEIVEDFKKTRADIFAAGQAKLLSIWLTDDRIKNMRAGEAALWFNSLYNNERLERGQSTQNISVADEYIRRRDTRKCNDNIELPSDSTK